MPFGQRERVPGRQVPERDGAAPRGHRVAKPAPVDVTGHPVEDHPGQLEVRIEPLEAQHHRARAPCHRPGVDDQDHRRAEPLRDLRGRARVALGAPAPSAIEAAHHALDEREVGARRLARHRRPHLLSRAHPAIEAVRRAAGHERVEAGIDEVRADLERLHREPASAQRLEQAEGDRGLPDAAPDPRDDERGDHRPSAAPVRHPPKAEETLTETRDRRRGLDENG